MTTLLDRDSAIPLYAQLSEILRQKIVSNEWKPSQKIPSENELNHIYGVSRMTARQVIAQLANEGLVFRVQGKGTFVAPQKIKTRSPVGYQGIRKQLEQQGYQTDTRLLSQQVVPATASMAQAFDVPLESPIYVIKRLRLVNGEPISLHTSEVPQALAPGLEDLDLIDVQLCVALAENYNLQMGEVDETLEITSATSPESKALEIPRNSPLLLLTQTISSGAGTVFERSKIVFRGDKIRLQFSYHA
jgi:GntR family transcriptional regulator